MTADIVRIVPLVVPGVCVMLDYMSVETEARLSRAARTYSRARAAMDAAREELVAAIVAERREGTLIEDITARVPYRQTQVNRILEAAGLTQPRRKQDA